jgi:hypothetical protein
MTDRKKPGWAFWTTMILVSLPVLYVASWGPVCKLRFDDKLPSWGVAIYDRMYVPIFFVNEKSKTAYKISSWYLTLWHVRGASRK